MPRRTRSIQGGYVYHVLNCSNACATLFLKEEDYLAFERILDEAFRRVPLLVLVPFARPLLVLRQRTMVQRIVESLGVESTLRPRGRPRETVPDS
jgi:hypothetical protein